MPGRGPQSFQKRQKEQQRKEKQQQKREKRLERKQQGVDAANPESHDELALERSPDEPGTGEHV